MFPSWPMDLEGAATTMRIWMEMASRTTIAAMAVSPGAMSTDAIRKVRTTMLNAWAEAWDRFARTPQFLDWMKFAMSGGAQWQKTVRGLLAQCQVPGTAKDSDASDAAVVTACQLQEQFQQQILAGMETLIGQLRQFGVRAGSSQGESNGRQAIPKGVSPAEVVYREDKLKLLHYLSDQPPRHRTPLVIVFALVNRPYILDILPNKSVVSHFVRAGFDTYMVDWGVPDCEDRNNGLETYIDRYLVHVVDHVCQRTGADRVSLLGYCMGGTMSTMFTALYPEKVRNLILMAAGIDFSTREGLLNLWSDSENFDVDAVIDTYGNYPAQFLQASFLLLKPVGNLIEKPITFWERLDDHKFVNEFLTMETWLNDNIAVPGKVFRQFVKGLYQQNLLVQNRMPVGDRVVDLHSITCPVLNLMAEKDDLVPCSQSEPFNGLVGSTDKREIRLPAGHIGLAMGTRAQKELWPEAVRWLAERSS